MDIYMEEHEQVLRAKYPTKHSVQKLQDAKICSWFGDHLCDVLGINPDLAALARGLTWQVR